MPPAASSASNSKAADDDDDDEEKATAPGKKSARAHDENAVHLSGAKASPTSVTASPGDA